jgi:hypothetical protein
MVQRLKGSEDLNFSTFINDCDPRRESLDFLGERVYLWWGA